MEKIKVLFLGSFWLSYDYFTQNNVRKTFFFSIVGSAFFFILAVIFRQNFFWIICALCTAIALGISCYETQLARKNFHNEMKIKKALSTTNEDDKEEFTAEEKSYIKRRDRTFQNAFLVKLMFIILLVVLIINLL